MAKISKHILIQILFILCSFNFGYCLSIEGIWLPDKISWQTPDVDGLEETKYADISIMQFQKDGTFKLFQYTVYLINESEINISVPEGGNIFRGKWKISGNNIQVSYDEVFRSIEIMIVDGKKRETHFNKIFNFETSDLNSNRINTGKNIFIKSERLTNKSKEFMAKY